MIFIVLVFKHTFRSTYNRLINCVKIIILKFFECVLAEKSMINVKCIHASDKMTFSNFQLLDINKLYFTS